VCAGQVIRAPFGDVAVAMVDPADVAAVLVTALTETGHTGKIYRVSGPEALTPGDQVDVLAEVLGRELRFESIPDDEARAALPAQWAKPMPTHGSTSSATTRTSNQTSSRRFSSCSAARRGVYAAGWRQSRAPPMSRHGSSPGPIARYFQAL
jgi:uncharacterized protein YbjT (DUF2867 family)